MKNLTLLVGAMCLLATGCAQSGLLGGGGGCGCDPCHVSRSNSAPRPLICRDACLPCNGGLGLFKRKKDAGCDVDCGCVGDCGDYCDVCCDDGGCAGDAGCDVCGAGCGKNRTCRNCLERLRGARDQISCGWDDRCRSHVGNIASGLCPNGGGYPASYNHNPGPPTGQVAYPYYTVRGPRDFLQANPTRIGPN
ncbi:hypothetical protein [Adhaeretor mobilis]|nr:hypothetical protein [Adhaeretor mobilis]